jgi:hypothetical protein
MTSTTSTTTTRSRGAGSGFRSLRRLLAGLQHRKAPGTSRTSNGPVVRRVWREVAPGEWRWLHVDDHAVPK